MTSYSDAQIARFLRIDPEWKPPLVDNRFMWECDKLSHCRCYCTMCNNIVLNLRHEVPWNFSSNRGIPHTKHVMMIRQTGGGLRRRGGYKNQRILTK